MRNLQVWKFFNFMFAHCSKVLNQVHYSLLLCLGEAATTAHPTGATLQHQLGDCPQRPLGVGINHQHPLVAMRTSLHLGHPQVL